MSTAPESLDGFDANEDAAERAELFGERDPFAARRKKPSRIPTVRILSNGKSQSGGFRHVAKKPPRPRPIHGARHRRSPGPRPAGRRGSRRVGGGSRAGPDDDPGESEPPGLPLWRHDSWGSCTPNLIRVLIGGRP